MSDEKKPTPQPSTAPSPSVKAPTVSPQPAKPASAKTSAISRRAFVVGALGASTLLAVAAFAPPSLPSWDILNPLPPTKEGPTQVTTLMITRLPGPPDIPTQIVNPFYASDPVLSKVAAFNLTCVHLRCIVNPGYAGNPGSGEFRLQCPCHGSQYRLADAVPVAGPAFDLGLLPLPRVKLSYDPATGNITATDLDGVAGVGRTA